MLALADEVFASRSDPQQIDVNQQVLDRLCSIHPASVQGHDEPDGPVAWVLAFPSTENLMHLFLENRITERQLFEQTPLQATYSTLYLCSAMVLEEYRKKGFAKMLTLQAVEGIHADHPIKSLFAWTFSKAGDRLAKSIAKHTGLPLYLRHD